MEIKLQWKISYCVLSCFSSVWLIASLWTVAHQAPLSMEFSMQEYWSGLPFPSPEDLLHPGIKLTSFMSDALAGRFFTTSTTCLPDNLVFQVVQAGIKIARRNINNLRYADDITLIAESEEELKSLLMKVKKRRVNKLA